MPKGRADTPIIIKVPYGQEKHWSIWITGEDGIERNYSNRAFFNVTKKINNLWFVNVTLLGIKKSDNIKEENVVKIFSENKIVFKGIIKNIDYSNSYTTNLTCYGMASVLNKYETDTTYTNTATQTIYTALVDTATASDEYPITMSSDDGSYANVTIRFDDENNLKGLNDLTESINHEWYEDYGEFPYNTQNIHIVSSMGSTSSKYTFTNSNSCFNQRKQNTDDQCNYAVVLGYGDGVNQLKSECYHATDNRTTLASALSATETTSMTVTDGTDLPSSGNVWVGCEKITYAGKTGNNLTTLTRGVDYLGNVETTSNLTSGNGYAHEKGVAVFDAQYTTSSPESGSSISTYKLKKKTYTDPSILNQNALDRIANKIIENNNEPIETIYINSYQPHTVLDSVSLGDYITITDAQLDLSSASKRVTGMVFGFDDENGSYIQLQCSNIVPSFINRITGVEDETKKANKFMQGSTTIFNVQSYENCDDSYPLELRFFVPSDVITITDANLRYKIKDYRAYAGTSAGGGTGDLTGQGIVQGSGWGTDAMVFTVPDASTALPGTGQWTHQFYIAYHNASASPVTKTFKLGTSSGGGQLVNETDIEVPAWGIYEYYLTVGTTDYQGDTLYYSISPASGGSDDILWVRYTTYNAHTHAMTYNIDVSAGGSSETPTIEIGDDDDWESTKSTISGSGNIDITDSLKDLGNNIWVRIQFTPSNPCRVEANVFVKAFIEAD